MNVKPTRLRQLSKKSNQPIFNLRIRYYWIEITKVLIAVAIKQ